MIDAETYRLGPEVFPFDIFVSSDVLSRGYRRLVRSWVSN